MSGGSYSQTGTSTMFRIPQRPFEKQQVQGTSAGANVDFDYVEELIKDV
jgi:cell division protein FtsZ